MRVTLTLLVVPASAQAAANAAAQSLQKSVSGTDGGQFTFTVPLFAIGDTTDATPRFYWSAPLLRPDVYAEVQGMLSQPQFAGSVAVQYDLDSNPGFPQEWLAGAGLRTSLSKIP